MKKFLVSLTLIFALITFAYNVERDSASPVAKMSARAASTAADTNKIPGVVPDSGATTIAGTNKRPAADACISAASKWALWINGTCLRGANIWQGYNLPHYDGTLGSGPLGPPFLQADLNRLAALGANVVNIAHPGLYSETYPYALNADVQANLDKLLDRVQKANMFAVISFRTGPGRNEEDINPQDGLATINSVWRNQTEQDKWVEMWRYAANRYKDNPIVLGYDLMTEPHPNTLLPTPADVPADFYPMHANTLYDWNPLARRISAAIRQADAVTPILVAGMGWSAAAWLGSLTSNGDSKTVYMAHQYEPQEGYTHQPPPYTNTYGTTSGTYTRKDLVTQFAYISSFKASRNVPVGVNEIGVQRFQPNAAGFLNDEMDILESGGLNYSIWNWETSDPVFTGEHYDDFNFLRGANPSNHADVVPNVLLTVIQKHFQKNTVRPSNRSF